jgi:hypothetical protein
MADDNDTDLEDVWEDVRPPQLVQIVRNRPLDMQAALEVASEKAIFQLRPKLKKYDGEILDSELLGVMVTEGVKTFLDCWYGELKSYDLAGLVEIVLDSQNLTVDELTAFIKALPTSLLERICASSVGAQATGVHALMGVESARRTGHLSDYKVKRDIDGVLAVSFKDPNGKTVEVRLDEHFNVSEE